MTWSPSMCLFEEKINRQNIYDQRLDVYERIATYEGAEHLSRNIALHADFLTHRLQMIGNCIRQHVLNVTFERTKITRMVAHFKVDKRSRLWFMWCSSIRSEPHNRKYSYVKITDLGPMKNIPISLQGNAKVPASGVQRPPPAAAVISRRKSQVALDNIVHCQLCRNKAEADRMYEVSYRVLLKYEEKKLSEKGETGGALLPFLGDRKTSAPDTARSNETGDMRREDTQSGGGGQVHNIVHLESQRKVPKIFLRLHPELRESQFINALKDVVFLNQTTLVCEECYLKITQPYIAPLPVINHKSRQLPPPLHTGTSKVGYLLQKIKPDRPITTSDFLLRANSNFVKRSGSTPALLSPIGLQSHSSFFPRSETEQAQLSRQEVIPETQREDTEQKVEIERDVVKQHQLQLLKLSTGNFESDENWSHNIMLSAHKNKSIKNTTASSGRLFTPTQSSISRALAVQEQTRDLEERRLQKLLFTNSNFWRAGSAQSGPQIPYMARTKQFNYTGKFTNAKSEFQRTGFSYAGSLNSNELIVEQNSTPQDKEREIDETKPTQMLSGVELSLDALNQEQQTSFIKSELQSIKERNTRSSESLERANSQLRNVSLERPPPFPSFKSPYDTKKNGTGGGRGKKNKRKTHQFIGRLPLPPPRKMPEIEQRYEISQKPETSEQSFKRDDPLSHSQLGLVLAQAKAETRSAYTADDQKTRHNSQRSNLNQDLDCVKN